MIIEDLDPAYTIGKLELEKRNTIESLTELDLMNKNKSLELPSVIQRIALITSENAAGFQDYLQQLENNPYGYQFQNHLLPAAVQGEKAVMEIVGQLNRIKRHPEKYDCVVIIRGGGAKLDLRVFDQLDLCSAIAVCPLPVLTGIGHEVDESVADMVANQTFKTPTAVAEYLIHHNTQFESKLIQVGQLVSSLVNDQLHQEQLKLQELTPLIRLKSEYMIQNQEQMLTYLSAEIPKLSDRTLRLQQERIQHLEAICTLMAPESILKRGFTLTKKEGKFIKNPASLKKGDKLSTVFYNGEVDSEVIGKNQKLKHE